MKNNQFIAIIIIVLIIVIAAALFGIYSMLPKDSSTEQQTAEFEDADMKNTDLHIALVNDFNLEDSLVDATQERVLVRYNETQTIKTSGIVKTIASIYPDTKKIIIQKFIDFEPKEQAEIAIGDALALLEGTLTEEEFSKKIIVSTLSPN